jgi:hypothetical protein
MPTCLIHDDVHLPKQALEVHHKHPTAYGGPDVPENRCVLCASCHSAVHSIAQKLYARRAGEAHDIIEQYLPNQPARQERMKKLAGIIVQARTTHVRSAEIPEAGIDQTDDVVKMSLEVPTWLHHRLKTLAIGTGLYRYVLTVLANHVVVATTKQGAGKSELYGKTTVVTTPEPASPYAADFTK